MKEYGFNFNFKRDYLAELIPSNQEVDSWYSALCVMLPKWKINTVDRVACFIAQCSHESCEFTVLSENLNYSSTALNKVFPKYFIKAGRSADLYHRQPERIANIVYSNRLGNSDEASGDGWRYRGGGLIQLTGKNNYKHFSQAVNITLDKAVEYVRTPNGAVESACWFWEKNNLNVFCDKKDIVGLSVKINGGSNGLDDRIKKWNKALSVLDQGKEFTVLSLGSRGDDVIRLQHALKIAADGIFGPNTERRLKKWQLDNNLIPDGIAGYNTLTKLLG